MERTEVGLSCAIRWQGASYILTLKPLTLISELDFGFGPWYRPAADMTPDMESLSPLSHRRARWIIRGFRRALR
jgi:hypothetical protein